MGNDDVGALLNDQALRERGLTMFFPAWNEEAGIERAVGVAVEADESLKANGDIDEWELLIVDDASTDSTANIVDALARNNDRIVVVHHEVNRKLGGSIKTGFANARGAFVLYSDSDLPFDLMELGKAFRLMRQHEADIVSMYRNDRTGEGPRRLLYSFGYNALIHTVVGLRIRDVNFSGKLIRHEVLDAVNLHSEGSFIDVELLAKAQRQGFRIVQFGVDYFPRSRGVSTLSSASVIAKMLAEMVRIIPEIRSSGVRVKPR